MKTDLTKIMSVSGHHGLFRYLAQSRTGVIAEALSDGKRVAFDAHSRISTLSDIAIYTPEGEMKLQDVLVALKNSGLDVPSAKAPQSEVVAFFGNAIPNYDSDRFYYSHMKKVLDWYAEIDKYASFDFVTDEDREKEVEQD